MGVDFFPCDNCGESICDCGDYWRCQECGHRLCEGRDGCSRKLVEYNEESGKDICPYCIGLVATDTQLLDWALDKLEMTREELLKDYQNCVDFSSGE